MSSKHGERRKDYRKALSTEDYLKFTTYRVSKGRVTEREREREREREGGGGERFKERGGQGGRKGRGTVRDCLLRIWLLLLVVSRQIFLAWCITCMIPVEETQRRRRESERRDVH